MKRYELKLIDGGKGVFKVSVVKDPAIEQNLVYFSKEKEEVTMFADEEKKVIYSVVMRPNMDIFRKNINGEPANVYYTKETVEKAQINYFRQNGNSKTNINHSEIADADGIFPFESWIVLDAKTDRAAKIGLDVQDGDWVMGLKVDNDELWTEHIKTGKLDGFSVEATNINYELKEDIKMNSEKKGVIAFIKDGLENLFGEAEKFEGQIAEVNKWWQDVINDTFEIGEQVMRKPYKSAEKGAKEEPPKPIGAGEFELKDGSKILTDSEGIIRYKTTAPAPAPAPAPADPNAAPAAAAPAAPAATPAAEKMAVETTAAPAAPATPALAAPAETKLTDEEIKALQAENAALKAELATLKAEKVKTETTLATMKTEKEAVDAKLLAMSKQTPAAQFVKDLPPAPETKEYKDMTNAEKMRFNRENKKY